MLPRPALARSLGGALALLLFAACGEHDWENELGRVGGTAGVGGSAGAGGVAGAGGAAVALPCEVEAVLVAKCQRCHRDPPQNGAPFPLLRWQDTQRIYFGRPVHERMLAAVQSDFMPLTQLQLDPPVEPLTAEEKATLVDWLSAGAEPVDESVGCP